MPERPRIFMTAAYLVLVEPKTYGLFRDVVSEERDPRDGKVTRERVGKPVGPIGLFRECEGDERPDMRSSDRDGRPLSLKKLS